MEVQTCGRPIDALLEKVLCMNILSSDYFKELYRLQTFSEVVDEVYNQVDHVEPWMTGNCRGPSTSFCLLYKFFTMKLTVKQMHSLLKHPDSPYIRAVGFLYLRYVGDPKTLWGWYEPYVKDDEEFSPGSNKKMTTMGVYIRDLLLDQYYFDTLFPRIPEPVMRQIVAHLERLNLPKNPAGVTGTSGRRASEEISRRPPSVKAALSVSFGQRAPHRASTRDSSPVRRTVPVSRDSQRNGDDRGQNERDKTKDIDYFSGRNRERERSREVDRERERDRERGRSRDYDQDYRGKGRDRDRDREAGKDYDRDVNRSKERSYGRDRERDRDRDRRDRYFERGMDRDGDGRGRERSIERERYRDKDRRRDYRCRSRSPQKPVRSGSADVYRSKSPVKEREYLATNLAKLKDVYGDATAKSTEVKEDVYSSKNTSSDDVIRLGGNTWR